MTPKEKAEKLVLKYLRLQENGSTNWFHKGLAKQCALIAVDEIIYVAQYECHAPRGYNPHETVEYWEEVKQEIEKL